MRTRGQRCKTTQSRRQRTRPTRLELLESRVLLSTYYVDAGAGSDVAAGSTAAPWKTLQKAADSVVAGDNVIVRAGNYAGFSLTRSGDASARITFSAQSGVVIDRASAIADNAGVPAGINLGMATDVPSYVTIEGFTLRPLAGEGEWYAGIRAAGKSSPRLVGLVLRDNVCDLRTIDQPTPDKYGIYVAWSDGSLVEDNVTSGCYNSGIYVANSSRNYVVRGNDVSDCGGNGIHNNGDAAAGAPGINSNGLLENNVIHNVGYGIGGQAISCDGLQDSVIRNNLIYDAHAKGISLYVTNASDGSKRNVVANNTVITAADSTGSCLRIPGGSTGNTIFNNIFLSARSSVSGDGGYSYSDEAGSNFYDYNVVTDQVQRQISLASWRGQGRDVHGVAASAADLATIFVNVAVGAGAAGYQLKIGSRAIDLGTSSFNGKSAPTADADGAARPQGLAHDAGAYEFALLPDLTPPTVSAVAAINVASTAATITWSTDERADAQVEYGTSTDYGSATPRRASLLTAHAQALTGLSPLTTYHYRVLSRDAAGNLTVSDDFTFTTPDIDATAPAITAVAAAGITSAAATVTWLTDEPADAQVEFGTTTDYGSTTTLRNSLLIAHSAALSGLSPDTTYHYRVRSRDASGNLALSEDFTFTTGPAPDAIPPIASSSPLAGITIAGDTRYTFTVTYTDDTALNASTFDSADIRVTGPNAFSQLATLVSVDTGELTRRTVTYQFTPPGGTWNSADNGIYTISLRASQVADAAGNAIPATTLGVVNVSIPDTATDVIPPTVIQGAFRYNQGPHALFFQFSEPVTGITSQALIVYNTTTQQSLDRNLFTVNYDPATFTAVVAFTGLPGGILPDGDYYIELDGDVIFDPAGNAVDGNANGIPGGNYRLTPFVLQGDINRDRVVDHADFMILYANFGAAGDLSKGDLNFNSKVDFADFQILERCMGHTLGPAPAPAVTSSATTPAVVPTRAPARPGPAKRPDRRIFSSSRI